MSKKIVFTYGRFQSPSIGHAKLVNKVVSLAKETGADHKIYPSKSQDSTNNPIPYKEKVGHLRTLFPNANIEDDPNAHSVFHIAKGLENHGYDDVTMVVGKDRIHEFQSKIGKYVKPADHPDYDPSKHLNFKSFKVVSAGDRDSNSSGAHGASGTKMRAWAKSGDFNSFASHTPTNNINVARSIFNSVKRNLKESMGHNDFQPMADNFIDYAASFLELKSVPQIKFQSVDAPSFGGYNPSTGDIVIHTKDRHPMDIFRTVAHELVHHQQKENGTLTNPAEDGITGSPIENEANSVAAVIMRNYGRMYPESFSLNSLTEETDLLNEGLHDKGIFKAVFLAGGPGSGKDYVLKNTFSGLGLVEINSDYAFEFLLKKNNLSLTMPASELQQRMPIRDRAKNITQEKQKLAIIGRLGLIINGTADDPEKITRIKNGLEDIGYSSLMVFVNTSDDISKARNIERGSLGGRTVPENIRSQKYQLAQKAKEILSRIFGHDNFLEVNNDADLRTASENVRKTVAQNFMQIHKEIIKFLNKSPTNSKALEWMNSKQEKQSSLSKKATMKHLRESANTKTKQTHSQAFQSARDSGSYIFDFEGKKYYTRKSGELTNDWMKTLEQNRHKNPKTVIKVQTKLPKPVKQKAGEPVPFIKDSKGNSMDHVILAHKNRMANRLDEDLETFLEQDGAGEWGTKKLRKTYEEDTPNSTDTTSIPLITPGTGVGPTFDLKWPPGFAVIEAKLPNDKKVKDWALKESTQKRFYEKYGDKGPDKLLETAINLAKT